MVVGGWGVGGGWRLGRSGRESEPWHFSFVAVGARGANPSSGTFSGGWRSGRDGARIRAHKLLGESEPRDFCWLALALPIANPSPQTFGRESELANFRRPMDQGNLIFLEDGVSDTETNYQ